MLGVRNIRPALLFLMSLSATLACDGGGLTTQNPGPGSPGALTLTSTDWRYFSKNGLPFLVAGPGGPEDLLFHGQRNADGTRAGGDQASVTQTLESRGGRALYIQAVKSHGGDGIFANGSNQACPEQSSCYRYANPFPDGDPTFAADPTILDQWDSWLSRADSAGIVINFFMYDDGACPWVGVATGGRITDRDQCRLQTGLIPEEDTRLITPLVQRFKHLRNLVWVVSEEYSEAITTARASAIAARIRALDPDHAIGVHHLSGQSFQFTSDPNVRVFDLQLSEAVNTPALVYGSLSRAVDAAAGTYAVVLAESAWQRMLVAAGDRTLLRQSNWAAVMGGAAGILVYGIWEPTAPGAGVLEDLERLKTFVESADWATMSDATSFAGSSTDFARQAAGGDFILYSARCAPGAELGFSNVGPEGDYSVQWFDPLDGSVSSETRHLVAGNNSFTAPAHVSGECAAWVH
jgi:Protein of unknown function (DUF4038)